MAEFSKRGEISGVTWDWLTEIVTTCFELHIFPPRETTEANSTETLRDSTDLQRWDEEEVIQFLTRFRPFMEAQRVFLLCNELRMERAMQLMHQWEDEWEAENEREHHQQSGGYVDIDMATKRPRGASKKPQWDTLDNLLNVRVTYLYV